jgi:hypothetical protein
MLSPFEFQLLFRLFLESVAAVSGTKVPAGGFWNQRRNMNAI